MSHLEPASPASCPLVQLKIVYYGPSGAGKTATLRRLAARLLHASRVFTLDTSEARTLFFDLLPIRLTHAKGSVLLRLISVPGSPMHRPMRRLLLRGADGVILLPAHDDAERADATTHAPGSGLPCRGRTGTEAGFEELRSNLRECGITVESLPVVVQPSPHDSADDASMLQALLSIVQAAWPAAAARAEGRSPAAALIMAALRQALGVSGAGHTAADGTAVAGTGDDAELMRVPCGPQPLAELWSQRARSGIPSGGVPRS